MTISFARHHFPPRSSSTPRSGYLIETVRRWVLKFGPLFARELRGRRPRPTTRWHLDEMAVMIAGQRLWLWRAVDDEGEVLDLPVQRQRNKAAAVKLLRKLIDHGPIWVLLGSETANCDLSP